MNGLTRLQIARKAAYEALDEDLDSIRKHIEAHPNIDGVVTGDETRLRQVITNLARYAFFRFIENFN